MVKQARYDGLYLCLYRDRLLQASMLAFPESFAPSREHAVTLGTVIDADASPYGAMSPQIAMERGRIHVHRVALDRRGDKPFADRGDLIRDDGKHRTEEIVFISAVVVERGGDLLGETLCLWAPKRPNAVPRRLSVPGFNDPRPLRRTSCGWKSSRGDLWRPGPRLSRSTRHRDRIVAGETRLPRHRR